jgi:hypothetical protein
VSATPPIVIIALAANELSSPRTAAILKSAQDVLGQDVAVRVEVFEGGSNLPNRPNEHPTSAYAWLGWDSRDPRVAHLRCYVPEDHRWVSRDVSFAEQDPETERGRTLGFVIASIFVEAREPQAQPVLYVPQHPQKQEQPEERRFLIEAAASVAAPGDATSLGAWIAAERSLTRAFWLGLAGEGRIGTVAPAQASTRFLSLGAVSTVRLFPRNERGWWGLRTLLGAEHVAFMHLSEDDPSAVTQSAWVPKLELLAHGNLDLGSSSMLFLDLGANYRFGSTDVYVHQLLKAHIPAFVGVGRLGVAARF